ncbi:MAG: hypothetical protein LQ341_003328 [Variospora aurantia]|nr:MAG: hypothetical protein LQ341_003328 [Variospora aurantia]
MADGLLGRQDVAGPAAARQPSVPAGPPRQILPLIIAPSYMVVSTESGKAAVVTAAPSVHREPQAGLTVDSNTSITPPLTPTILSSTPSASTPTPLASPSFGPTSTPSQGLSKGKLAAAIVVPVVLLLILTPLAIVWWIRSRRKQKAAKRRSDRSSRQRESLLEYYGGNSNISRDCSDRQAVSKVPLSKPKHANRIVSVPTPTFSSFNFELSRPASAGPFSSASPRSAHRPITRHRRSAIFPSEAPPPYTSPTRTAFSFSPVARPDNPIIPDAPLLGTAQMVHIRPINGQPVRLQRSNSRMTAHGTPTPSCASLTPSCYQVPDTLQAPAPARTRQESADSTAESVQFRSSLQRPFSVQPLASPTISEISGFSFDPTLWASRTYGTDFIVSPLGEDEEGQVRPHRIL